MPSTHPDTSGRPADRTIRILYDARSTYDVKVLAGIAEYVQGHAHLAVALDGDAPHRRAWPRGATDHGVIADLNDRAIARLVRTSRVPVVGFGQPDGAMPRRIPQFVANNARIAELAAEHLVAGGAARLAFCGYRAAETTRWSVERESAFAVWADTAGVPASVLRLPRRVVAGGGGVPDELMAWLDQLDAPVGIMAANDVLGRMVLDGCRRLGRRVPDDIAVIGVDNDDVLCRMGTPQLSSIELGAGRLGYAAATLLDRMLRGEGPASNGFVVDPTSVVVRESTRAIRAHDPDVARALVFIDAHLTGRVRPADVVGASRLTAPRLEHRFRAVTRASIAAAIRRARVRRVRELLSTTDLPLKQVASMAGFRSVQHMTTAFARAVGQTPARYRKVVGNL